MHYYNTFKAFHFLARKAACSGYHRVICTFKLRVGVMPCPLVWLSYTCENLCVPRQCCADASVPWFHSFSFFAQSRRSVFCRDWEMCMAPHHITLGLNSILSLFAQTIRSSVLAFRLLVLTRMPSSWLLYLFRSLLREILNLSLRSHTDVVAYNKNHPRKG
jgi:hypothetical protein